MNLIDADKAYANDPVFRKMVDIMEMTIMQLELTPAEIRKAATYAALRVERRKVSVPSIMIDIDG